MKTELDKNTFTKLYINKGMSLRKIAKMYGRSYFFARHRKLKYGIPTRPWSIKKGISKKVLQGLCVAEGMTAEMAAKQLSCSFITVRKRCKEYGIHLKGQRVKGITQTLLEKLYVQEGKSTREIAQELGCSFETVRKRCKQFGIPVRNPGTSKIAIDETTFRQLYVEEGRNIAEIAKLFDCSVGTLYLKVKRMGLKTREGQ